MHNQMKTGTGFSSAPVLSSILKKEYDNTVKTAKAFSFFNPVIAWKSPKGLQSEL